MGGSSASKQQRQPQDPRYNKSSSANSRRTRSSQPSSSKRSNNYLKDDKCAPDCCCCSCCGGGTGRRSSRKLLQLLETQSTILGEMGENARTTSQSALSLSRPNSRARSPSPAANPASVIATRSAAMAEQNEVISKTREIQEQLTNLRQRTETKLHKYENAITTTDRGEDLLEQLSAHVNFLRDRSQQLANTVSATSAAINPSTRGRSPPVVGADAAPQVIHRQLQYLSSELDRERQRLKDIVAQYSAMWLSGEGADRSPDRYARSQSPSPGRAPDSWSSSRDNLNRPSSSLPPPSNRADVLSRQANSATGRTTTSTTTTLTKVYHQGQPHYMPRKWDEKRPEINERGTDAQPGGAYYRPAVQPRAPVEDPTDFLLNKILQWLDSVEAWLVRCPIMSPGTDAYNLTPLMKIRDTAQVYAKEGEFYAEQRAFLVSLPSRTLAQTKTAQNVELRLNRVRNALADASSLATQGCELTNANKTAVIMLSEQTEAMAAKCQEFDRQGSMGDATSASKWLEYLLDSIQTLAIRHRNGKSAVERDVAAFYTRCQQLCDDRSNFGILMRSTPRPTVPSALTPVPPTLESLVKNITGRLLDIVTKNESMISQMRGRLGTLLSTRITAEQRVVEAWQTVCDIELRRQAVVSNENAPDRQMGQQIATLQQLKAELAQVVQNEQMSGEKAPPLLGSAFFRLASVVETAINGDIERLERSLPKDDTSSIVSSVPENDRQQQQWSGLLAGIDSDLNTAEVKLAEFESTPVNVWLVPESSDSPTSPFTSIITRLSGAGNRLYEIAFYIDSAPPGDYSAILRQLNDVERRLTLLWRRFSETVLVRAVQYRSSSPEPTDEQSQLAQGLVKSSGEAVRSFATFLARLLEISSPSSKPHLCVSTNCCVHDKEFDSQLSDAVNGLRTLASQLGSGSDQTAADYREQLNSALQAIASVQASLDAQKDRRNAYATAWRHYVEAEQQLNERLRRLRGVVDRVMGTPPSSPATNLPPEEQFETLAVEANDIAKSAELLGQQCRDYFKSGSPQSGSPTREDRLFVEAEVLAARFGWITVDGKQLAARLVGGANSAKVDANRRVTEQRESENFATRLVNVERVRSTTLDLRPMYPSSRRTLALRIEIDWILDKIRRTFDTELGALRQARPSSLAMIDNAMGRISDLEGSSVVAKFALNALKDVLQDLENCTADLVPYADSDLDKFKTNASWRLQLAYRQADWLLKQLADAKWRFAPSLRSAFETHYGNVKLSCLSMVVKKPPTPPCPADESEEEKPPPPIASPDAVDDLNCLQIVTEQEQDFEPSPPVILTGDVVSYGGDVRVENGEEVDDAEINQVDENFPCEENEEEGLSSSTTTAFDGSDYDNMVVMSTNDTSTSGDGRGRRPSPRDSSGSDNKVTSEEYTVYHTRYNPPPTQPPYSEYSSNRYPYPSSQTRQPPAPASVFDPSALSRSRSSNEQSVLEKPPAEPHQLLVEDENSTNKGVVLPQSAVIVICGSGLYDNNNNNDSEKIISPSSSDTSSSTYNTNLAAPQEEGQQQNQLLEDDAKRKKQLNQTEQLTAVKIQQISTLKVETVSTTITKKFAVSPSDFVVVLPPPPPGFDDEGKAATSRVLRVGGASSLLQPDEQQSSPSNSQIRRSLPVRLNKEHRLSSIPESPRQTGSPTFDSGGIPRNESAPSSLFAVLSPEEVKAEEERANRINALDIAQPRSPPKSPTRHLGKQQQLAVQPASKAGKEQLQIVFPTSEAPPSPVETTYSSSVQKEPVISQFQSQSPRADMAPASSGDEASSSSKSPPESIERRRAETPGLCFEVRLAGEAKPADTSFDFVDALANTADECPRDWEKHLLVDSSAQTEPIFEQETSKPLTVIITSDDDSALSIGTKRRGSSESSNFSSSWSSHPPTTPSPRSNTSDPVPMATSSPETPEIHRVHRVPKFRQQQQQPSTVVVHPRDPVDQEYLAPIKFPSSSNDPPVARVLFEDKSSSPIKMSTLVTSTRNLIEAETQTLLVELEQKVPAECQTNAKDVTNSSTGDDVVMTLSQSISTNTLTPLPGGQSVASQADELPEVIKTETGDMEAQTDCVPTLMAVSMQAGPCTSDASISAICSTANQSSETSAPSFDSKSTTAAPVLVTTECQGDVITTEHVGVGDESPVNLTSVDSQTMPPPPGFDATVQTGVPWSDRCETASNTILPEVKTGEMEAQTDYVTIRDARNLTTSSVGDNIALTQNMSTNTSAPLPGQSVASQAEIEASTIACGSEELIKNVPETWEMEAQTETLALMNASLQVVPTTSDVSVSAICTTTNQSSETGTPSVDSKSIETDAPISPVMVSAECQGNAVTTEHVSVGSELPFFDLITAHSQTIAPPPGFDATNQVGPSWSDRVETGALTEIETGDMGAQTEASTLMNASLQAGPSTSEFQDASTSAVCVTSNQSSETVGPSVDSKSTTTAGIPSIGVDAETDALISPTLVSAECQGNAVTTEHASVGDESPFYDLTSVQSQTVAPPPGFDAGHQTGPSWCDRVETGALTEPVEVAETGEIGAQTETSTLMNASLQAGPSTSEFHDASTMSTVFTVANQASETTMPSFESKSTSTHGIPSNGVDAETDAPVVPVMVTSECQGDAVGVEHVGVGEPLDMSSVHSQTISPQSGSDATFQTGVSWSNRSDMATMPEILTTGEMEAQTDYSASTLTNVSMQAAPSMSEMEVSAICSTSNQSSETIAISVDTKSTTTLGIPSLGVDAETSAPISPAMVNSECQVSEAVSTENVGVGEDLPINLLSVESQTVPPHPGSDISFQAGASWLDRCETGALTDEIKVETGEMGAQTEASSVNTVSMQVGPSTSQLEDASVSAICSTSDQSIETTTLQPVGVDAETSTPASPELINSECQGDAVDREHVGVGEPLDLASVHSQTISPQPGSDATFQTGVSWSNRSDMATMPKEIETGEMEAQTDYPSTLLTISLQTGASTSDLQDASVSATCTTDSQSSETISVIVDSKSTTTLGIPSIGVDAETSAPVSPAMINFECQVSEGVSTENVSVGGDSSFDLPSVESQTISTTLSGFDANFQAGTPWSDRCEMAINTAELPDSDNKTTSTIEVDMTNRSTCMTPPPSTTSSASQFDIINTTSPTFHDVSVGNDDQIEVRDSSTSPDHYVGGIENVVQAIFDDASTLTIAIETSDMASSPMSPALVRNRESQVDVIKTVNMSSGGDLQLPGEMLESSTSTSPPPTTGENETQTSPVPPVISTDSQAGVPFSSCYNEAGVSAVCPVSHMAVDSEDLVLTSEQWTATLIVDTGEVSTSPIPSPRRFESCTQSTPVSMADAEISAIWSTMSVAVDIEDLIMTAEQSTATLIVDTDDRSTSPMPPAGIETFESSTQSSPPPLVIETGVNAICNIANASSGSDMVTPTGDSKSTETTVISMETVGTSPVPAARVFEIGSQASTDLVTICVGGEPSTTAEFGTTMTPNPEEDVLMTISCYGETQTSPSRSPQPEWDVVDLAVQTSPSPVIQLDMATEASFAQKLDLAPLYEFIAQQLERLLIEQEQERVSTIPKLMSPADSVSCRSSLNNVMCLLANQKSALVDLTNRVDALSSQAGGDEDEQAGAILVKLDSEINHLDGGLNAAKFLEEKTSPFDSKLSEIMSTLTDLLDEKSNSMRNVEDLRNRLETVIEKAAELGMFTLNDSGCFENEEVANVSPVCEQVPGEDHHGMLSSLAGGIQQNKVAKMREDLHRAEALVAERERQEVVRGRVADISRRLDVLLREAASVVDSTGQVANEFALERCDEILRAGLQLADDMEGITSETAPVCPRSADTSRWSGSSASSVSSFFGEHLRNQQLQVDALRRQLCDYQKSTRDELATQEAFEKCRDAVCDAQRRLVSLRMQIDDVANEFSKPALAIDDELFEQTRRLIEEDLAPQIAKLEDALASHGAELSALASKRPTDKKGGKNPSSLDPVEELVEALVDCRRNTGACTRRLGELSGLQSSVVRERAACDAIIEDCRRRLTKAQCLYDEMVSPSLSETDRVKLADLLLNWCRMEADITFCRDCVTRKIGEVKKDTPRHHQLSQLLGDVDVLEWYIVQVMETVQNKVAQQKAQEHVLVSVMPERVEELPGSSATDGKPQGENSDAENKEQLQAKRGVGKGANRAKKALRQKAAANKKGQKKQAESLPPTIQESHEIEEKQVESEEVVVETASEQRVETLAPEPVTQMQVEQVQDELVETISVTVGECLVEMPAETVVLPSEIREESYPRQRKEKSPSVDDGKEDESTLKRSGSVSASSSRRSSTAANAAPAGDSSAMSPTLRRVLVAVPVAILASTIAILALMHWLLPQLCPGDTPCELQNNLRRSLTLMLTYQQGPPPT